MIVVVSASIRCKHWSVKCVWVPAGHWQPSLSWLLHVWLAWGVEQLSGHELLDSMWTMLYRHGLSVETNTLILMYQKPAKTQKWVKCMYAIFSWITLTAKCRISPLGGVATYIGTLSGVLCDGFAEERVIFFFTVAHVSHTGFCKGFSIQKGLATTEWRAGEDLVTEFLGGKKSINGTIKCCSVTLLKV